MTREEYADLLGELLDELPEAFFRRLNLGIVVSDEIMRHPQSQGDELLVLGEYQNQGVMGRQIVMYWKCFNLVYGNMPRRLARMYLQKTLRHEFRHHMEALAGEHALEREDMETIQRYLSR